MSKASQSDLDTLRQFFDILETRLNDPELDSHDLGNWLRTAYDDIEGKWERILLGYEILVANVCDPTLTYLDYNPTIKSLLTRPSPDPYITQTPDGRFTIIRP
jgi:hypothetical protein